MILNSFFPEPIFSLSGTCIIEILTVYLAVAVISYMFIFSISFQYLLGKFLELLQVMIHFSAMQPLFFLIQSIGFVQLLHISYLVFPFGSVQLLVPYYYPLISVKIFIKLKFLICLVPFCLVQHSLFHLLSLLL